MTDDPDQPPQQPPKKKKKRRKRRRRKKKKDLPEHLVREEDFEGLGVDPVSMMGSADAEIEEEKQEIQQETEQPSDEPEDVNEILPSGFLSLPEYDGTSPQKYQFTLAVAEIKIGVRQEGSMRVPEVTFLCRIALTHYYLFTVEGGAKRPGLNYLPITDPFEIKLPAQLLPKSVRKSPDSLSPKAASDLLMSMFNQMDWEQIRPAPKPDHERIIPDNIMRMMGIPKKGGS